MQSVFAEPVKADSSSFIYAIASNDFVADNVHEYSLDSGTSYHSQPLNGTVDPEDRVVKDPTGGVRVGTARWGHRCQKRQ